MIEFGLFKKSVVLTLFVISLWTLLWLACSDDDGSSPDPTPTATMTPTATPIPNSAPETYITSAPEVVTAFPAVFTFIGADVEDPVEALTYSWRLDSGDWSSWQAATTATFQAMANGEHIFEVKARDTEGLEDDTPAFANFTVNVTGDDQAPETWIISGPSGTIQTDEALFAYTGSDDETATEDLLFSWLLDNGSWSSFSSETSAYFSGLAEGTHTFSVRARDEAGNIDTTPDSRTFTIELSYYGFSMTPATQSASGQAGEELQFQVNVQNTGSLDSSFVFNIIRNFPDGWVGYYCLSSGQCIYDSVTIDFAAGAADYMIVHIISDIAAQAGDQGIATLSAQCVDDPSVYVEASTTYIVE